MDDKTRFVLFDRFRLDTARGILHGPDGETRLRPKSYRVLLYLLQNGGRLVSRKELLDAVWGKAAVTDDSVTQCLVEIRRALGDKSRRLVRTVPRRGFLLDASLRTIAGSGSGDSGPAGAERDDGPSSAAFATRRRPVAPAVAALAVLGLGFAWLGFVRDEPGSPQPHAETQTGSSPDPALHGDALPVDGNAEAYENFAWGRHYFHRRQPGDVERARRHFEAAVELDPGFAAAWAALAGAHVVTLQPDARPTQPGIDRAMKAAERAVELDPASVEGHLRIAVLLSMQGDEEGAWHHMDIAARHDPDHMLLLGMHAGLALRSDDRETAIAIQEKMVQREPLSALHRYNLASMLLAGGKLEQAREELDRMRELESYGRPDRDILLTGILILEERFSEAADLLAVLPDSADRDAALAIATRALGRMAEYRNAVERLRHRDTASSLAGLAEIHAQAGDPDGAWDWLEASRERLPAGAPGARHWWLVNCSTSPFLAPLRDDPRWAALFESRRLSQSADGG